MDTTVATSNSALLLCIPEDPYSCHFHNPTHLGNMTVSMCHPLVTTFVPEQDADPRNLASLKRP